MKSVEFDYSEFSDYLQKLENFEKDFKSWLRTFILNQAQKCIERTKERQRALDLIDTGNMINSWYVGTVKQKGNSTEVTVGNPVEYAIYVELGHSQQPGRYVPAIGKRLVNSWVGGGFMFTISLDELERALPTRFKEQLDTFIKSMGV